MIVGIGTDLVEIERVSKACQNPRFLQKYFTENEILLIQKDQRKAASNFAVKEAVSKVLGTGFGPIAPIEIETLRTEHGKPYVLLYGKAKERADELSIARIHVSITNTKALASVFVIGEDE